MQTEQKQVKKLWSEYEEEEEQEEQPEAAISWTEEPKREEIKQSAAERRREQQEKQIQMGKRTAAYQRYVQLVPPASRQEHLKYSTHPVTPPATLSKRGFTGQVKAWRRLIHQYDVPIAEIGQGFDIQKYAQEHGAEAAEAEAWRIEKERELALQKQQMARERERKRRESRAKAHTHTYAHSGASASAFSWY